MKDARKQSNVEWLEGYEAALGNKVSEREVTEGKPDIARKTGNFECKPGTQASNSDSLKIHEPDLAPLIPEGFYVVSCVGYQFGDYRGDPNITLTYKILEGRYAGTRLEGFFNLDWRKGEKGERILAPRPRRAYVRRMQNLFSEIRTSGGDWLSPENLVGNTYKVRVKTVNRDGERKELGASRYSKVTNEIELVK